MKTALLRVLAGIVIAVALSAPTAGYSQASAQFMPQQLDQLLAPIALYPDPLLGQILMAATYPLEVVEAARWLQDPGNAGLKGDDLFAALQREDWDPSVKSLVPFPQLLQMMSSQLGWLQQIGDAFLVQQAEVMDAVQRLRAQALAAGTLYSTPGTIVSSDGTTTTIEPADPQLLYLPAYDPAIIYGGWPYPDYPPYAFPPHPGYPLTIGGGISFGMGFTIVIPLWGWEVCDWRGHRIRIDHDRYNAINRDRRPPATSENWQHDPLHRRGIAYRDQQSRQKFLGNPRGSAAPRRAYRGFEGVPPVIPPPARPDFTVPQLPPAGERRRVLGQDRAQAPAPVPPRSSATFGEVDRGRDVQREAQRGRASRQVLTPPAQGQPAAAPREVAPSRGTPAGRAGRRER